MNSASKIICLILFLILLFIDDIILLILLTVLTVIMMLLSKVPLKLYLKVISGLKVLIIFMILITLLFNSSWYIAITSIVKVVLGLIYTMVLTYTTSKSEITYGLEKVFGPLSILKLPIKQMSLSLTLALRFIPTIFEKTEKIMKSQASRGIDFRHTNVKGKVIAISSMMVPMFLLTSKKANAVADAMEVRLYNLNTRRTNYRFHQWHSFDDNMVLIHGALLIYFGLRVILS
jgi:energy-coupling factor transport system permease protein